MVTTPKEIIFDQKARDALLSGIKELRDAVAFALGPKGRNAVLGKKWGGPMISNHGATIIREISSTDKAKDAGMKLAKSAIEEVKDLCGDGTTTCMILLHEIVKNGIQNIAAGASPINLKRGIDKAVDAILKELEKSAIPIQSKQEKQSVATVSASGDEEVGKFIADALEAVSHSGAVIIEEGKSTQTHSEIVKGMKFDKGYLSPYFCTNLEKMIVEMNDAHILLVDKKISTIHEIFPILEGVAASGKSLLIIAEDMEGDTLSTLVFNRLRGHLKIAAVKSPGFGDRRKAMLQDIAILTGATVVSEETGISLKDLDASVLGFAGKVTITKDATTIAEGSGEESEIKNRIRQIEREITEAKSSYDREKLEERLAKLTGGVAFIRVGGASEAEVKDKKQRFEDSLYATRAALKKGVVPGGGVALINASRCIESLALQGEEALGGKIVAQACLEPLKQIALNAGLNGDVVVKQIQQLPINYGLNVMQEGGAIEDLVKARIVDPAEVLRIALLNAASAAGTIILSEVLIFDADEENEAPAAKRA